jgi:dihydrofolate synthase / folylpolyglutamate synthase
MKNYPQLLEHLYSINKLGGMKLGLKNCLDLDRLLKNPSKAFPSIHVAGTNGKGSVSTKTAAAYEAAGYKVGLYTSPHLSSFRERIRINGRMISENEVERHMNRLFSICQEHGINATFFELTTLMAFMHFAAEKIDYAVLETGLGGRLDATNIVTPILSIITSISLEHTEILGNTIEEIALEKAGIIKPFVPVVIGPRVPFEVIKPAALEKNSPFTQVEGHFPDFHEENCAIAKQALEILGLPAEAVSIGLNALPPCRLQTFSEKELVAAGFSKPLPKAIILDVAHNPDGMRHLLKAIRHRYAKDPLRFVLGLSSNKDIAGCLNAMKEEASAFHLVEAANDRAAPKEQLAKELSKLGVEKVFCEQNISAAIGNAIKQATNEVVIVCGTFFIMDEARRALGIEEPQDLLDMN